MNRVWLLLLFGRQALQAVEGSAVTGGNCGGVFASALGDHLGGGSGVGADVDMPFLVLGKEGGTLLDCLLMRVDFPDILRLCAGKGQQRVIDLDPRGTDDIAVMPDQQVVDAVDGTGQAVLDGQDPVLAQPALDSAEDVLKGPAVHDRGIADHLFAGQLGISALHTLAGDHGLFGKERGHGGNGFPDLLSQCAFRTAVQLLAQPAVVQQQMIQGTDSLLIFLTGQISNLIQQVPFPFTVQHGQVVLLLVSADGAGNVHPPAVEVHDPAIDVVDLLSQFIDIHTETPYLIRMMRHSIIPVTSGAMTVQRKYRYARGTIGKYWVERKHPKYNRVIDRRK